MVGRCTLEPGELRAPKASWTAERFILLGSIANLRVRVDGRRAELRREKMEIIEKLAYKKAKVTYKDIRRALDADGEWTFEGLPRAKEGKDPEDAVFAELKGFHAFKKTISAALGKEYWDTLITTSPEMLDALACALTFRKTDDDILQYLEERGVERKLAEAVLSLNFSKCVNLSLKAMGRLIPFMEAQGCRYDEACALAGYSHYAPGGETERSAFLPVPDWEGLRNPVVIRAVAQTRKVVNAIIRRYGPPTYIQIELARELSHSAEERKKIEKEQNENRDKKDALALDYAKQFVDKLLDPEVGFPNCKIGIGLCGPGADYSYAAGSSMCIFRKSINTLNLALIKNFDEGKYHPNVTCFAHGLRTNRRLAYPYSNKPVTDRFEETSRTLTNSIHPSVRGYQAWADGYYCQIRAWLEEDAAQ